MTVTDNELAAAANPAARWCEVCPAADLIGGRGVAVLLPDDRQAAVFWVPGAPSAAPAEAYYAVDNIDPFGRAAVMSRGLVGDRGGIPTVASPLLKQVFSLVDGVCLDHPEVRLVVYPVKVEDGVVYLAA